MHLTIHLLPEKKMRLTFSVASPYSFGYKLMGGCSSSSSHKQETRNPVITLEAYMSLY